MHNVVETRIEAPRATVWRLLADFSTYPAWNPFTPQVIGECAPGAEVRVLVRLDGEPFWMPRQVVVAEAPARFAWVGRAWYSFLAPGQRTISLHDDGPEATRVVDDEVVGGLSVLMPARMKDTLRQRMREFGDGLKTAAEAGHRPSPGGAP